MLQLDWIQLGVALLLAVIAGFLAAGGAAVQAISKSKAKKLAEDGARSAKIILEISKDPAPYVNSALFMGTLCGISSITLVAAVVFRHFPLPWQQLLITISIMVVISYVLWGVAPRTMGRQRSAGVLAIMARPIAFFDTMLGPIPELMIAIGNAVTPGVGFVDGPFSTEAELRELVDMAERSAVIEADERKMIHSVFELGDTICKEVMVPRTDVVYIGGQKTLRQGISLALRSGFSRIPVIGENRDEILGVFFLKDAMRRIYDLPDAERTETVASLMRKASFCPDSKPIDELLREMQTSRTHLMVVVDEFGGTAGLVTIEDILEEIVGEIVDEYDAEPDLVQEVGDNVYRVSARMPVDDVGELFGLDVDDDDVETLGGLMAKEMNMVPIPGSEIEWNGIHIKAERSKGRRHQIDTCIVRLAEEESEGSDD